MKRLGTLTAMLVILMAGFMSVCIAHENCAPDAVHAAVHDTSSPPAKEVKDHCGMLCHVAPHSIPQVVADTFSAHGLGQGRIQETDDTIRLGLYTVLDQPPRA